MNASKDTRIIVPAKRSIVILEWSVTAILAIVTVTNLVKIPQDPEARATLSAIFGVFTGVAGLVAWSVTKSRLELNGSVLLNSATRKSINLDQLASVRLSAGYAYTKQLTLRDKNATSIVINFSGYPAVALRPLIKALKPHIIADTVDRSDAVIKQIDLFISG